MLIKGGKLNLVWIDFPSRKAIPSQKTMATMRTITTWMRQAAVSGACSILMGLRGKQWQDESLQALVSDNIVHEASIHLCHFDIKVSNDTALPSSVQLHAYATCILHSGIKMQA
jgi:hypothetical protein